MLPGFTKCWLWWSLVVALALATTWSFRPEWLLETDEVTVRSATNGALWLDKLSAFIGSRDLTFVLMLAYGLFREGE